jgi:2',3'-cyclic-nucleotide 2'-phosphodiesterase (5'-nucleotidase family)
VRPTRNWAWKVYLICIFQDILLAKSLLALSPSARRNTQIAASHGADLLLGGHDHLYYAAKGVTSWECFDTTKDCLGAENDCGDILVVKSGSDFRDLSEMTLELESTPPGSIRKMVIKSICGRPQASLLAMIHFLHERRQTTHDESGIEIIRKAADNSQDSSILRFLNIKSTPLQINRGY